jgi:hypothetical protein
MLHNLWLLGGASAQVRRIRARLKGAQKSAPRTYGPSPAAPVGV